MKRLLLLLLGLLSQPASAQQIPSTSIEARREIAAAFEKGDRIALTHAAMALTEMGAGFSDAEFDRIAPMLDPATITAPPYRWRQGPNGPVELLRHHFHENAVPIPFGSRPEHYAWVPARYRLVEGIAYDFATARLFIGTVVEGRLAYREKGRWREVPIGSPRGGLFGMAVDAKRRLLWIATGSVAQTAVPGKRLTGLIALDLDRLRVVHRIPVPAGRQGTEGDLAIAEDGTVYSSNSATGAIHRCRPGCVRLETLVAPGRFPSPQGLAVAPDGEHLIVADYATGIWIVDVKDGSAAPPHLDSPVMLDGIDGLRIERGPNAERLVGIQNGTFPRRIVKFYIDTDGTGMGHPREIFTFPASAGEATLGTLIEHQTMFFVADGQWERYGPGGRLKDGKPARPTPIHSMSFREPDGTFQ
ncbi:MAG: hypothetical protein V4574_15575 [Pseudomonadota bacterium]